MANSCKFQKTQYQVSYDSGTTWEDVVPSQFAKGELLEYDSPDCTSIQTIYRWRTLEGQYLCDGNKKYTKQIQEESYDNGETWYVSYPTIYRGGEYVGDDAEFCCDKFIGHYIYVAPTPTCSNGYYWNGVRCVRNSGTPSGLGPKYYYDPLKVIKCDGNGSLTSADTKYYTNNYYLISAEIGDSVTSIDNSAFSGCTRLASIDIPDSVTSIGDSAFTRCNTITSLTIPDSVASIGNSAFSNCSNLNDITIKATTPPNLQENAFYNTNNCPIYVPCSSLSTYIQEWCSYANRITSIQPCEDLFKLKIFYSNGTSYRVACDCSKYIYSYGSLFTDMTSAIIGECVEIIGSDCFEKCSGLTSVTISNTVTTIGDFAFDKCTSLESIVIPNSVTYIGNGSFRGCTSLTSIDIPSGVTYIGTSAFNGCSGLTSITVNAITPPSLKLYVFDYTNDCAIYVPSASVNAYKSASGWSDYADRIQAIPT